MLDLATAPGSAPPATDAPVAVIVPATDGPRTLRRCVEALEDALRPGDELVVVELPERSSPAAARNAGARATTSPVLVFVDSDIVVAVVALERLRVALETRAELTAVFGSYDDAPADPGLVSVFRNLLHHHVHQSSAGPATTFWAGLGAIRRPAFERAGGFDEGRYARSCIEDVELGMRIAAAGDRIELDPCAQGTHLKQWTLGRMLWTDLVHRAIPWASLLLERREAPATLNLSWRHRLSAAASVILVGASLARRPVPTVAASGFLAAANRTFYGLLWRRRGPVAAAAGVGLHALHHVTAVAAVVVVLAERLLGAPRRRRRDG